MTPPTNAWEVRLAALWRALDGLDEADFLAQMAELLRELPSESAVAAFEQAAAFDSTGHSDRAVPLYRRALSLGLTGERRRRAVIQLASSLRNLGQAPESLALLRAERAEGPDHLDSAVDAFLALALSEMGREREALAVALQALARHLPRYQRSVTNYARDLVEPAS
ncbi:tetratricopeptide repeat protein [Deinococcus multiflagellatus]|uniref:Tetratricopeptide repeat protein n=1 Tax=Deinococcus multiflagellatus TaxID=1656887 RepID=A0ABW1ZID4_9DEIO|nr:tetratricopeptide repeat protein [Deinococcus multiflagellatus]MBZ9712073.1 tetratricopeptide repeat protein [Deinococcus multiflagellatus]